VIVVFTMAAVIWGIGWAMKAPRQARWMMIGLLFVAVLGIQVALPDGHPLREGTGGSPAFWLLIAAFAGLALLYARGLRYLRERSGTAPAATGSEVARGPAGAGAEGRAGPGPGAGTGGSTPRKMGEVELERYARHIVLRELGGPGQRALKHASVLVVGAGGLGAPALLYLAAAGVGRIGVIDDDRVENANLQRQVIFRDADIGLPKVFAAAEAMKAQNPYTEVRPYNRRLTPEIAAELIGEYDLVLDGSDDFATRAAVNRACVETETPLVSGALSAWEAQVSLFDPARGGPCYACVFPSPAAPGLAPSCAEAGVLGPLPGVAGAMMAVEAIKVLADAGTGLRGRLALYDALHAETRTIRIKPNADCAVCAGRGAGIASPGEARRA
jgi:molybdopterin/thiamine biosynthesis adenylyltransferase